MILLIGKANIKNKLAAIVKNNKPEQQRNINSMSNGSTYMSEL